ncbi:MAG TPA: LysM peptidoglycan-binding domain-containing protein [Chitinophagaceae bacterium]|jgi:LysM repeat protein|nr:LysM peptidoglycan-binding domain-containing protein [Chitinophagaceae bacterium]
MKKSWLLALVLFLTTVAFSQNTLLIQKDEKGLFLSHTVTPKETFYSVGRLYHIAPKDIAAFNGLDMAAGLTIGQTVRIPLTEANFTQSTIGNVPVYYVVGEKEGLYRVSINNNKVTLDNLRKWNNLPSDGVSVGQRLVVGYLLSPEGAALAARPATTPSTPAATTQRETTTAAPATDTAPSRPAETTVKREESPRRTETAAVNPAPANNRPASSAPARTALNDGNGGYFKSHFEQQSRSQSAGKDLTVTSGIFKTASGWQDTKYYALMDNVEPGTIVRVVNPTNNRAIYAKVLGQMSGIRQNQGMDLRISNAAATVLEINDTEKFVVRVAY